MLRFLVILLFCYIDWTMASSFFYERYRGWLWFENKKRDQVKELDRDITKKMQDAKRYNEHFKEELELLRHLVIRYPENLEYIKQYKEKEKIMFANAMILARNFVMTDFLNPNIADHIENPQNIYARDAKRAIENEKREKVLMSLSENIELFLFIRGNCKYSEILDKHLARFAERYGFTVDAISVDQRAESKFFKTSYDETLVSRLQLDVVPSVIAVTKNSNTRFEIARGAVSIVELEDNCILLSQYLRGNESNIKSEK